MPRRPLLVLASIAAAAVFFAFILIPATPAYRGLHDVLPSKWGSSNTDRKVTPQRPAIVYSAEDLAEADRHALKALKLGGPFEYRRRCIDVRKAKAVKRTKLERVERGLFEVPASKGLTTNDPLPPCQETLKVDVPYFDERAEVDTSELFLGVATKLSRANDSVTAWARWLAETGSPLLVLLVDQANLTAKAEEIEAVRAKAEAHGIEMLFEPYTGNPKDSEGLKNFALAEAFVKHQRPTTRWYGLVDDDTFFTSLPTALYQLQALDPAEEYYVGELTEGFYRIGLQEGFKAWGGAGFFISPPLMHKLAANSERCNPLDTGFGDILWRDCILEVTSPTVQLTRLPGLNQIDLWGDISGFYESGLVPLLTVHHWKSWHVFNIPLSHTVADISGPEAWMQRYLFSEDNTVMTNGFSIVSYPNGLPDLNLTELTFVENVGVTKTPDRMAFHHSVIGMTRPALQQGRYKFSWGFQHSSYDLRDGSVRQFYVKRKSEGVPGSVDSVIEVDWRRA
ncbi:hypothetical protein LTR10_007759 [Elasticomyces elasticus]|nr:hypothetical protein LTR10_007759 [Elasticomyces elasticus]KAK4970760.1 hypothetical protein LTR42_007736 [Elasticomyces elasticus]